MIQGVETLRCLIVDDSRTFMAVAAAVLERDGVSVVGTTTTGEEALQVLGRLRPDVMLVDVDLGAESGFDLADAIHRQSWTAGEEPAVILISAHDARDFADMVATSPAVGFLPKPRLSAAAIRELLAAR